MKLADIKKGDRVWCGGNSGFCRSETEIVDDVMLRYDGLTGIPYNVIVLSGYRLFDSRDGRAMNPPLAYHIEVLT